MDSDGKALLQDGGTAAPAAGVSANTPTPPWEDLRSKIQGKIVLFEQEDFLDHLKFFNSASNPSTTVAQDDGSQKDKGPCPQALTFPLSSADIAHIVRFGRTHGLSISVKSGGFNPSNWSSSGQLVIDLKELDDIHAHIKGEDLTLAGSVNGKGKRKASPSLDTDDQRSEQPSRSRKPSKLSGHTLHAHQAHQGVPAPSTSSSGSDVASPSLADGPPPPPRSENPDPSPDLRSEGGDRETSDSMSSADSPVNTATNAANSRLSTSGNNVAPGTQGPVTPEGEGEGRRDTQMTDVDGNNHSDGREADGTSQTQQQQKLSFMLGKTYPALNLERGDGQGENGNGRLDTASRYHARLSTSGITANNNNNNSAGSTLSGSSSSARNHRQTDSQAPGAIPVEESRHTEAFTSLGLGASHRVSSPTDLHNTFGVQDPTDYITVSFGAGVKARTLDSYTEKHGYIVPLACYPVGTAIFTTGGYGYTSRLFGLSMDLTTELEVVLASGELCTLRADYETFPGFSPEERVKQEELWYVFRGAGTAFGIVTRITAKAFRIGKVLTGNLIFPFNPATTPSLLKHWRDCWKSAPRELYANFTLTAGPNASSHVVVVQFSWCGARQSDGETLLQAFLSWDGERCLLKDVEVRPFTHQQDNVSQILTSKDDTRWLVRSTLLTSLTDEAIHRTVDNFRNVPAGASWLFELSGGAIGEPAGPTCYPVAHRKAPFQTAALHQWVGKADDARNRSAANGWIYDVLGKESCAPFPCFLGSGEGRERMVQVYGQENWDRLSSLKRQYDPDGVLRYTHFEDELLK